MKKILTATLSIALAISMLTACAPKEETAKNGETAKNVNKIVTDYTTEGKVTQLVGDPNATGELVISCFSKPGINDDGSMADDFINLAVKKFKELYPNVKIVIECGEDSMAFPEYYSKLSTQVMSGSGPDIFFISGSDMDVNKMMKSGSLANMYEFFENDKNFNIDDYNATVFCGGQPSKSQYVVPITYTIPMYISTEKMLAKGGIDLSKMNDYLSFMQEIDKAIQKEELKDVLPLWDINSTPIWFPRFSGIDRYNYDDATTNLDVPEFKAIFELLKTHREKYTSFDSNTVYDTVNTPKRFHDEKMLLLDTVLFSSPEITADMFTNLSRFGEVPTLFSIRNMDGKITASTYAGTAAAVSVGSKNKQNAYNYLKILLDREFVSSNFYLTGTRGFSVANQAVELSIKKYYERLKTGLGSEYDAVLASSEEFVKQYNALVDDISGVDYNFCADSYFYGEMQPYFKGEKSYEDCIKSAKEKLEIYISE